MSFEIIFNPKTKIEFNQACSFVLYRAPKVVIFGGTSLWPEGAKIMQATGHSVYLEKSRITLSLLKLHHVRQQSPARYEYYRKLLTGDPGATLPRSKVLRSKNDDHLVAINIPSSE